MLKYFNKYINDENNASYGTPLDCTIHKHRPSRNPEVNSVYRLQVQVNDGTGGGFEDVDMSSCSGCTYTVRFHFIACIYSMYIVIIMQSFMYFSLL